MATSTDTIQELADREYKYGFPESPPPRGFSPPAPGPIGPREHRDLRTWASRRKVPTVAAGRELEGGRNEGPSRVSAGGDHRGAL